jgi:hypothetical protein
LIASVLVMNRRLIFISDSSDGGRWDVELRQHLREALQARKYEVFLDEYSLSPGDMWRPKVYRALSQCVGGGSDAIW